MRHRIPLDIYTILIIAIVPVFLATAGALAWNHGRVEKRELCANAATWLEDVSGFASVYTDSDVLRETTVWVSQVETTGSPGAARDLKDAVLSSMSYAMNTDPNLETTGTGEVYDALSPFQQSLDDARTGLATECPDTAPLVPEAFPMFFREGAL